MTVQFPGIGDSAVKPPEAAAKRVSVLLDSSTKAREALSDWLDGDSDLTLSLSDCIQSFQRFCAQKDFPIEDSKALVEAFFDLESLRRAIGWSPIKLLNRLTEINSESNDDGDADDDIPERLDEVAKLFDERESVEMLYKALSLYEGSLPNFEECSSLCEFRPVFSRSRAKIKGGIIDASLSIEIRDPAKNGDRRKLIFQLDLADVDRLIQELDLIREKTKVLKEGIREEWHLFNPSDSVGDLEG